MDHLKKKMEHESFLAKKKAEILARKSNEKNIPAHSSSFDESASKSTSQIPFANDGSFLEKFLAIQKVQQKNQQDQMGASDNIKSASFIINQEFNEKKNFINTNKINTELKKPAAIFLEEDSSVNEEYSSCEYDLAKELAAKVIEGGVKAEASARIQYADDARYRFLFEPTNPVAKYYQKELKLQREAFENSGSETIAKKRKLKSAEDETEATDDGAALRNTQSSSSSLPVQLNLESQFEQAKALIRAKAAKMLGSTNPQKTLSEEEVRKCKQKEEQKMMNDIYRKVIEDQARAMASAAKKKKGDKPNYEYDSDEDVEGGTWEHKKRMYEMEKTKAWAMELTEDGRGKHHLADFLPAEELEKFMEKVQAVREGREADFSDYSKYRIQADNLGYKMLQKAGWEEGKGLGSNGEGIQQPINKGKISFDQSGVGAQKVAEVKKEDDDFDLYRKRMMLAYKFRPNPLNNPRRPYYE